MNERERMLRIEPIRASAIATNLRTELNGPDLIIQGVGDLGRRLGVGDLVYLSDSSYQDSLPESGAVVLTTQALKALVPSGNAVIVVNDPRGAWAHSLLELHDRVTCDLDGIHPSAVIDPTARISGNVRILSNARVGPGAVVIGPAHIGAHASIGPNSVIGEGGFEIAEFEGKRFLVPHLGGVWIEDEVEIRALTAIDKALRLNFTVVGRGTKIDNLVHIAHGVSIGANCTIVAGAEISGATTIGAGVWIGPQSSVINGVSIGDGAFSGIGSTIRRDVESHSVIVGAHQVFGYRCACGIIWKIGELPMSCTCSRTIERPESL